MNLQRFSQERVCDFEDIQVILSWILSLDKSYKFLFDEWHIYTHLRT